MSPEPRRRVVPHLRRRFGVSERRACAVIGQARSTHRRRRAVEPEEEHLRKQLRALATGHPRWGYRKQHALLCREGITINRKRVRRLWREEGLQVRRRKRRRRKGAKAPGHQTASHPNHTWAMDYQFDETAGGRRLKILNVTDEFTREALASRVGRSIDASLTVKVLSELVRRRGAPAYVRCDNGPEFVSEALKRWCLRSGTRTSFIEPGAPWQNAFVESFNGRMREELLNLEVFDSLFEARVLIEDWRVEYNDCDNVTFSHGWAFGETGRFVKSSTDTSTGASDHHKDLTYKDQNGNWPFWTYNSEAACGNPCISNWHYHFCTDTEYNILKNGDPDAC